MRIVNRILAERRAVPALVRHDGWDYHLHAIDSGAPLADRIAVETAMAMIDLVRADELSRLAVCAEHELRRASCSTCPATGPAGSAARPAATGSPSPPTAPGRPAPEPPPSPNVGRTTQFGERPAGPLPFAVLMHAHRATRATAIPVLVALLTALPVAGP